MGEKTIRFEEIEVKKYTFHQKNIPISIYNVNSDRTVVSNKISFGKKCLKFLVG